MSNPEWLKSGLYGAVIAAAAVGIVGFTWGGWVTGRTSQDRAMAMVHDEFIAATVPVCLNTARTGPDRAAKLATIRDASALQRRDAQIEADWATVPGAKAPDRDVAQTFLASLDVDGIPERPETEEDEG